MCNIVRQFIIADTTIEKTRETLLSFPHRYHNYHAKKCKGEWRIEQWSEGKIIQLALVDQLFSLDRVKISFRHTTKTESPIFYIRLCEIENGVILNYQYKSQLRVLLMYLIALLYIVTNASFALFLLLTNLLIQATFLFILTVFPIVFLLICILRRLRHNALASEVFEEILGKNFKIVSKKEKEEGGLREP